MKTLSRNNGFTLMEVLAALGILSIVIYIALTYSSTNSQNTALARYVGTKNRVVATIRDFASMPATLRSSMLASLNGVSVNPQLLACAGGEPVNSCNSGVEYPFTMFSPIMGRDSTGAIIGVQPISAAKASPNPFRVDSFGSPCTVAGPDCSLMIFTSMIAQCGPAVQTASPPSPINNEILPQATCTVADVIQVNYFIQVDQNLIATNPGLVSMLGTTSGSVTIPVTQISGNVPQ